MCQLCVGQTVYRLLHAVGPALEQVSSHVPVPGVR